MKYVAGSKASLVMAKIVMAKTVMVKAVVGKAVGKTSARLLPHRSTSHHHKFRWAILIFPMITLLATQITVADTIPADKQQQDSPTTQNTGFRENKYFADYNDILERYQKRRKRQSSGIGHQTAPPTMRSTTSMQSTPSMQSTTRNHSRADSSLSKQQFSTNIQTGIQRETSLNLRKEEAQFSWNIADISPNEQAPNILSELIWDDLVINKITLNHKLLLHRGMLKRLHLEADVAFGLVNEGWVTDSDYDGDDRTEEYSRSVSKPLGSKLLSLSNAIGYRWQLTYQLSLTPLLGYTYHAQRFLITKGRQIIATADRTPAAGDIHGLNSQYDAFWYGPWMGIEVNFQQKRHRVTARGLVSDTRYHAEANWNLRADLAHPKSFEHDADASNYSAFLSYSYQVNRRFAMLLSFNSERWRTEAGIDRIYFEDGSISTTALNQARWDSDSMTLGLLARY